VRPSGHAIECRIYAEDPARGYLPSSGRITYFLPPEGDGVRNDVGAEAGIDVPAEYDSLLAKLLVHAPSREEALERCARALDAYAIEGVKTNLGLLQAVMANPAFAAGAADLATLEGIPPAAFAPRLPDEVLLAAAAIDVGRLEAAPTADPWEALGPWRAGGRSPLEYTYHGRTFALEVERVVGGTSAWRTNIDGRDHEFAATTGAPGEVVVREAEVERRWAVRRDGSHLILESQGRRYVLGRPDRSASDVSLAAAAKSAGALRAPMPGVVVRILVAEGAKVAARQPLVLLEAMKMEHIIESNVDGVVKKVACRVGQKVAEGDVLIELESGEAEGGASS
jgi:acetyl/propionyl-CoA carboxylase alpha subunit